MNPESQVKPDPRRSLPAVGRLARAVRERVPELPDWACAEAARQLLDALRASMGRGEHPWAADPGALAERAEAAARELARIRPGPVVNATGIAIHTNLGRAPLAPGAVAAAAAAAGYSDLELDLASGERGDRSAAVALKLERLSGAEAALVANNNAAALLLALDTLARGREVVVSRGELVEIGGSFRVPDVMERAGVRLVEVGTTNRTHLRDYEQAIGAETALLLKVHRSNFEQRGYVAEVELGALAALGRERGLPVVEDLGSATLVNLARHGFPPEADAGSRLRLGADVVCFSGDKLLGGPQAGLVLGRRAVLDAMRRNPLARALRLDKLGLAALDWTLGCLLAGREREIPVLRQLTTPAAELMARARALAERLADLGTEGVELGCLPERAFVGGGTLPGFALDSWVVTVSSRVRSAAALAAQLRVGDPPVVARVRDGRVLLDVRTLLPGDEGRVEAALRAALEPPAV